MHQRRTLGFRWTERMRFEWDGSKAKSNFDKHAVAFPEAATVLGDVLSATIADPRTPAQEQRFVTIGRSALGRLLVVVHTGRADAIRIISARRATSAERRSYEEET